MNVMCHDQHKLDNGTIKTSSDIEDRSDQFIEKWAESIKRLWNSSYHRKRETSIWLENWGVVCPGLKIRGVMGPNNSIDRGACVQYRIEGITESPRNFYLIIYKTCVYFW